MMRLGRGRGLSRVPTPRSSFPITHKMNTKLILAGLFGLAAYAAPLAMGNTVAGTPEAATRDSATDQVAQALADAAYINDARPNKKARYFIYLCSASWCGPCKAIMPQVVAGYEEMRKSGVADIILIGFDQTPEAAAAYLDSYKAPFAGIMKADAAGLPGMKMPAGIPFACIVDASGKLIRNAHGSIALKWKDVITQYETQQGLPSSFTSEADSEVSESVDDESAPNDEDRKKDKKKAGSGKVAKTLGKVEFLTKTKPNLKAKYYIYLCSASWCGPCNAEMPHVVKAYKKMKADKVELILVSADNSEKAAEGFLKKYGAKFPAMMSTAGVKELPGFTPPRSIPYAIIVDADGKVLKQGHGAIALKWRDFIDSADVAADEDEEDDSASGTKKKKSKKSKKQSKRSSDED